MQSATNPLTEDEQFIVEANNAVGGNQLEDVVDDPPEEFTSSRIQCIDVVGSDEALLVLDDLDDSGLNETVTVDRDELL